MTNNKSARHRGVLMSGSSKNFTLSRWNSSRGEMKGILLLLGVACLTSAWGTAQVPITAPVTHKGLEGQTPALSAQDQWKAEGFYLKGALAFDKKDFSRAVAQFTRAVGLAPNDTVYAAALSVAKEQMVGPSAQKPSNIDASAQKSASVSSSNSPNILLFTDISTTPESNESLNSSTALQPKPEAFLSLPASAVLRPLEQTIDLHLSGSAEQIVRSSFAGFGIKTVLGDSMSTQKFDLHLEGATFAEMLRSVAYLTHIFSVPLDGHTALLLQDTPANRGRYERWSNESIELPLLTSEQALEIQHMAKDLLAIDKISILLNQRLMEVRAPNEQLELFNALLMDLFHDPSEILIEVQLYETSRSRTRKIGLQLPQQATVFNLNTEAQKFISENQSVVDQAVAAGLVKSTDTLGIVELLIANGYGGSSPLAGGFAYFGGGLSLSALGFGTTTFHLALNAAETHLIDTLQMRVKDREAGTFRYGTKYPITTSKYTSVSSSTNLNGVDTSNLTASQRAALGLSDTSSSTSSTIPQVQYEDLGITLTATPHLQLGGLVNLHLDLKIRSLSGSSIDDIPILNNRQFSGDVTIQADETALMASSLTVQESGDLNGVAGLSDLPGFQGASSSKNRQKDTQELMVLVTPHVIRPHRSSLVGPVLAVPTPLVDTSQ